MSDINLSGIPIYNYHQKVIQLIMKKAKILLVNRNYGLKLIAKEMNISVIRLNNWISIHSFGIKSGKQLIKRLVNSFIDKINFKEK